jgi:hypothetical protein
LGGGALAGGGGGGTLAAGSGGFSGALASASGAASFGPASLAFSCADFFVAVARVVVRGFGAVRVVVVVCAPAVRGVALNTAIPKISPSAIANALEKRDRCLSMAMESRSVESTNAFEQSRQRKQEI